MSKYLTIAVPQSCSEDWNQMLPEEKGRFCLACQKKVIDFTAFSDSELIQFFKKRNASTCGRFNPDQLNRNIPINAPHIPWIKYFFRFTVPAFLLSLKANAQPSASIPITITAGKSKPAQTDTLALPTITVRGTIQDKQGGPVSYATVMIKGSQTGTAADSLGRFELNNVPVGTVLSIEALGFISSEYQVNGIEMKYPITLISQEVLYGSVGVVVTAVRKKKKARPVIAEMQPVTDGIHVYPNPVVSGSLLQIQCRNLKEGPYRVEVINVNGNTVQSTNSLLEKGSNALRIPIQQIMGGVYFLRLVHQKTGKAYSQEIIVQ